MRRLHCCARALHRCGVLNIDDVKPFIALFDKMDRDHSGLLTMEDLDVAATEAEAEMRNAESRRASLAESKNRGSVLQITGLNKMTNKALADSQYTQAVQMASRLPSPAQRADTMPLPAQQRADPSPAQQQVAAQQAATAQLAAEKQAAAAKLAAAKQVAAEKQAAAAKAKQQAAAKQAAAAKLPFGESGETDAGKLESTAHISPLI